MGLKLGILDVYTVKVEPYHYGIESLCLLFYVSLHIRKSLTVMGLKLPTM